MSGAHLRFEIPLERFLADLTGAACDAVLRTHGRKTRESLQTEISKALKEIIQKEMQVSAQCGRRIIGICTHVERFEPWSEAAKELEK